MNILQRSARVGCVEPEVLAAFVDRGLSLAERARVESHLASCFQCTALLAGVVRTVETLSDHATSARAGKGAIPRLDRSSLVGVLTAAAAVIAVLVVPSMRPWLERDAGLVSLVETTGHKRLVLGRLTGGFPHAPLGAPSAGGQDGGVAGSDRLVLIADKIRESFGERETPSRLHALGLSQLLLGRFDDASRSLLAASREQPENAKYLSDVAVVQLERARTGLHPDDLPRALAAADRATRLDPSLREAWFNRALATTALSLTDQAKQAWTDYLARDSASPWASEARTRLAALSQSTPASAWTGLEVRLRGTIDTELADEAVRTQTTEARQFIETVLLPAWAAAVERGDGGASELGRIRQMADAMQRVAGDALYHDAVAAIDRTESQQGDALRSLARAHAQYAEAAALFADDRIGAAAPGFASARTAFERLGSPFAVRATVELGAIAHISGKPADAESVLASVLPALLERGYGYATGRALWFRGLAAFAQGRFDDVQARYDDTLATFERMGDAEQVAGAHGLLAGLSYQFGDKQSEWRHRLLSFEGLSISRSPRTRYVLLNSAAASIRFESPDTALSIQEIVLVEAIASGREAPVADVLAQRAMTLLALGRRTEAATDLAHARQRLLAVSDPQLRSLIEIPVLAAESDLLRGTDPARAVSAASRAIQTAQRRADNPRLAQLNLRLAKAHLAAGHPDQAAQALAAGIQAFETARAATADEGRFSTSEESWQLFETAVQLALKQGALDKAFAMAERARVRTLAEAKRLPAGRSLTDVARTLAKDEAVIALNQFDDELAIWLIRPGSVSVVTRPISRRDAKRLIARQRDEIRLETSVPEASAALYNTILRPLGDKLAGIKRLVVVPDLPYQEVAFAGLWNSSRRRFLVDDYSLTLAPSVSAVAASDRNEKGLRSLDTPLVAGGPGQVSETNARAVAAVYKSADLLNGSSATSARLFAAASSRAIVHVSARVSENDAYPLLSRLILADEPGRRYSGAVLGRDIAARSFARTNLVVLGEASSNGNGEDPTGTLSVARAFLAAGVPNVLATLPGIDETSSRNLIVGFHQQLASNASAGEALTQLQRNVLQSNGRRIGAWCALVLYGSDR